MIYVELFWTFLQVGAFSFGGGYGMIALIRELTVEKGWLTEEALLNMIAVAESTPGPIAVNMATFVGATQGGIGGSLAATLGVVLPSFLIILLIAALMQRLLKYAGVKAFLGGVRPCVVGLILSTAVTMLLGQLLNFSRWGHIPAPDWRGLVILALLAAVGILIPKLLKKTLPPPLTVLIAAVLGMLFYGVLA